MTKSELRTMIREVLKEEFSKNKLNEALDYVAALKSKGSNEGWYTEYFAVGLSYEENSSGDIYTMEDFDYELPDDIEENYTVLPIVFGPHLYRTYSKEEHDTLEDALDYVIENLYSDSDLACDIKSYTSLFDIALMGDTKDNSATFIVAYAPDVQDDYGCYMRVSQKPLNSNKNLGAYYLGKPAKSAPHLLADMAYTGIIGSYGDDPNFDDTRYAWQAK